MKRLIFSQMNLKNANKCLPFGYLGNNKINKHFLAFTIDYVSDVKLY